MTIFNLGSINIDMVYSLDRLPKPGETIAALGFDEGLGGKGANQSIAIARAGGDVVHIGATGPQAEWTLDILKNSGVDITQIAQLQTPTGHAVINVDQQGENAIVLLSGANAEITEDQITKALAQANSGDWFLLQNETNLCEASAKQAHQQDLKICYSAAPFSVDAVAKILPYTALLVVNEVEFQQLHDSLPNAGDALSGIDVIVTYGAKGARYFSGQEQIEVAAYASKAVDTTGAGDTYLGYVLAALDRGAGVKEAMQEASAAAAIQVSRHGASAAIPERSEVEDFLKAQK